MLGELAWVLGLTHSTLINRLVARRMESAPNALMQLFTSTPTVEEPQATHSWSDHGVTPVGEIDCPGRLVMAENGWFHQGTCLPIDEPLHIAAKAGRWQVVCVRLDPKEVPVLQGPEVTEAQYEAWEATWGRSWIVLAAPGRPAVAPVPAMGEPDGATLDALAEQTAAWDDDPLTEVTLWAPQVDAGPEPLELLGIAEVEGGHLAVLAGDALTPAIAHALRQVTRRWSDGVSVWPWGVLHGHRRCAIPVFAGGPPHARTYLAFPGPLD